MADSPTSVVVDDPHDVGAGGDGHGDIHGGEVHMLQGHDGQMHPSNLQHFFVSSEQQFEASKLGMWLFLATEILLFGGMFVAYGIFRVLYPEVYEAASMQLDTVLGATNTLVLLLSSLTMAWAIRGAQMDNRKVLIGNLIATIVLASGFLVVKYFEYSHKFHEGIYPGIGFELREGTQSVAELDGVTALTPIYLPERHHQETGAADDVDSDNSLEADTAPAVVTPDPVIDPEVVESDAGERAFADAPLTGPDRAVGLADDEGATQIAESGSGDLDAARAAASGLVGRTGANVQAAVESEARRAGVELEPAESDDPAVRRAEAKEEIFSNRRAGIFFAIYYMMTGIHAIHIIIGIIAIGFLTFFASKGRYSSVWYTPVENVGLYWHIVDVIWIFVFPLMYLI